MVLISNFFASVGQEKWGIGKKLKHFTFRGISSVCLRQVDGRISRKQTHRADKGADV